MTPLPAVYLTDTGKKPKNVAGVAMVLLLRDVMLLYLGIFIVCIIERNDLEKPNFTIARVLFEMISGYGTIGLSLGYPGLITS